MNTKLSLKSRLLFALALVPLALLSGCGGAGGGSAGGGASTTGSGHRPTNPIAVIPTQSEKLESLAAAYTWKQEAIEIAQEASTEDEAAAKAKYNAARSEVNKWLIRQGLLANRPIGAVDFSKASAQPEPEAAVQAFLDSSERVESGAVLVLGKVLEYLVAEREKGREKLKVKLRHLQWDSWEAIRTPGYEWDALAE